MNWLSDFARPKLKALLGDRNTPDNLWVKCPNCGEMIFHRDIEAAHHVCPSCSHHMRISPEQRLAMIFDEGKYEVLELPEVPVDPLKFKDEKKYTDRLKEARNKSQHRDAMVASVGKLKGLDVVALVQNFGFMGGSLGMAAGEGFIKAAETALERKVPFIAFTAAGGARMQEGILSLMQMPRTTILVEMLKEAGLPYVVVLTDPTTGGVTASYAMLGDVHIAEPGALIGFAGPRVIKQTIREDLPEGFQRAEYLLDHGMVDMVVNRHDLRDTLARIISLLMNVELAVQDSKPGAPITELGEEKEDDKITVIEEAEPKQADRAEEEASDAEQNSEEEEIKLAASVMNSDDAATVTEPQSGDAPEIQLKAEPEVKSDASKPKIKPLPTIEQRGELAGQTP